MRALDGLGRFLGALLCATLWLLVVAYPWLIGAMTVLEHYAGD